MENLSNGWRELLSRSIKGNMRYLSGEKHFERETLDSTYYVMERAYGAFQRTIPLP